MRIQLPFTLLLVFLISGISYSQTGTWTKLTTNAPHQNMGVTLLMTDGTILCHNSVGLSYGTGWDKLTPSASGSYVNGIWTTVASMNNDRLFFSTQVLPSGKVYAAGGEYGAGTSLGEVYDPVANTWTNCGAIPAGWKIYDGNSELLYNGIVLEGPQIGSASSFNIEQWSPVTLNYTTEGNSPYNHDEAEWVKLPDSTVLFIGRSTQSSCRYLPKTNTWVNDGNVPDVLYDALEEAGAGFMLPNGKAVFFGATPHNAIYTPSGSASHHDSLPGTWTAAADFPTIRGTQMGQSDASAAMMVNGHILCAVSPVYTGNQQFPPPTYFVEYNYLTNTFTQVKSTIPGFAGDSLPTVSSYETQMLDLPDGTVLVSISQQGNLSYEYFVYTPGSAAIPQGKPTINSVLPDGCPNYRITGKLFNGISEGAAYGDDWQMSTNYPIVRLSSGTSVYYAKTTNWNRIGAVRTDSLEDTAYFTLPASLPAGTYSLVVVANGFASNPTLFTYQPLAITMSSHINVSCFGGTGSATANNATGGFSPYTYSWSANGGTKLTASGLFAGPYTITVTDNNGCTATASATITQPALLTISIASLSNVPCYGGVGSIISNTAIGGTSPYTYFWSDVNSQTSVIASSLTPGTYTLAVTDNNGCTISASSSITQPANPLAISIAGETDVNCHGAATGTATSNTASGGTSPYAYTWTPSGGASLAATGLTIGTYTITTTDMNGCTASASVNVVQVPNLVLTQHSIPVSASVNCDGSAYATVSGGVPPYTYQWYSYGNPSQIFATTDTIKKKCAGEYCCRVTDNIGCRDSVCINIGTKATGIENINNQASVNIYPNPNNGVFTVQYLGVSSQWSVEITNVLGQQVFSQLNIQPSILNIDLSEQPTGVYFFRAFNSSGALLDNGKLVIQR